jgi:hypothetical protein
MIFFCERYMRTITRTGSLTKPVERSKASISGKKEGEEKRG